MTHPRDETTTVDRCQEARAQLQEFAAAYEHQATSYRAGGDPLLALTSEGMAQGLALAIQVLDQVIAQSVTLEKLEASEGCNLVILVPGNVPALRAAVDEVNRIIDAALAGESLVHLWERGWNGHQAEWWITAEPDAIPLLEYALCNRVPVAHYERY
jgi:hypothetical protein